METVNGRFLPDDSQQSTDATIGSAHRTAEDDASSQGILKNASQRSSREAGLPEAECTLGSATPSTAANRQAASQKDVASCPTDEAPTANRQSNPPNPNQPDRYVELGELGRGGWGVVQRVLDRQLQREVAVKRISNPGVIRSGELEQFLHEARITSGLQHPGVVPVHELVADEDGDTYYVMKLLEGDTLRHHIRLAHVQHPDGFECRHELIDAITPLLDRFIDVCNAVAYAHRRGVIHRDLKPTNVMAGAFGETIVVDWGLARYIEDDTDETTLQGPAKRNDASGSQRSSAPMESEGSIVGTPSYMAPEQARGELASLGSHSDIYSLGVILYEIISGNHPHQGMNVKTVLRRARAGEFTPLEESQAYVPKPLQAIVHTAMTADLNQRYPDVESLAEDVRRFMSGQPVSVYQETLIERGVRWCSRHRAITSTIAVAVTLLMIVSVISTVVIRAAHQSEQTAKNEARDAHRQALERLVEARDTTDTWLVDLSGSLQFHPAMTPLREELIEQALDQYGRLIERPIAPISNRASFDQDDDAWKNHSLEWLERAKCHLRLGDLVRMQGDQTESHNHYRIAADILQKLQRTTLPVTTVSLRGEPLAEPPTDWLQRRPTLDELIRLEQINTVIGQALATAKQPTLADAVRAREQLESWIPWSPPDEEKQIPTQFTSRVISALVRLELVIGRTDPQTPASGRRVDSTDRYQNAVRWARWLASHRGKPGDLKLYESIATENAERFSRDADYANAHQAWSDLVTALQSRLKSKGARSDWMQSMAHAKIRRAEAAVHLGRVEQASSDYTAAIKDLEQTWSLTDADEFFRVNLATAENNLGRLWTHGNDPQREQAKRLFARSIATYQQLLSESATPDILRRLAQTHLAMAEVLQPTGSATDESELGKYRSHLDQARLAFQILDDQSLLTDTDRLDFAIALQAIHDSDGDQMDPESIKDLLGKIKTTSLTPQQRQRLNAINAQTR